MKKKFEKQLDKIIEKIRKRNSEKIWDFYNNDDIEKSTAILLDGAIFNNEDVAEIKDFLTNSIKQAFEGIKLSQYEDNKLGSIDLTSNEWFNRGYNSAVIQTENKKSEFLNN